MGMRCSELRPGSGHRRRANTKSVYDIRTKPVDTHLDHFLRRKALPSEVGCVLCQGILRLGHSRRSCLRGVHPSSAKSYVVTTTGNINKDREEERHLG
jgi:hypothetical protein